jgi:hypothetical protein
MTGALQGYSLHDRSKRWIRPFSIANSKSREVGGFPNITTRGAERREPLIGIRPHSCTELPSGVSASFEVCESADRVDVEDPQPILDSRQPVHDFRGGVFRNWPRGTTRLPVEHRLCTRGRSQSDAARDPMSTTCSTRSRVTPSASRELAMQRIVQRSHSNGLATRE